MSPHRPPRVPSPQPGPAADQVPEELVTTVLDPRPVAVRVEADPELARTIVAPPSAASELARTIVAPPSAARSDGQVGPGDTLIVPGGAATTPPPPPVPGMSAAGALAETLVIPDVTPADPLAETVAFGSATGAASASPELDTGALSLLGSLGRSQARSVIPLDALPDFTASQGESPRYALESLLGAGAMGEVVLARDTDIGRDVAVKRLLPNLENTDVMARFVDEIRLMGRMEHPNIAPIYDVGLDEDGRLFFVMQFVDGETLADIISRLQAGDAATHEAFPFMRRLEIFTGIVRALEFAHERGVLHRDIKPENIMIGSHGEVVVMDWGIARSVEVAEASSEGELPDSGRLAETSVGSVVGTPLYMSPEQARGNSAELDARSDLYSAFVVLFELLSLQRLVRDANSILEVVMKVTQEQAPGITDAVWASPLQPAVPSELRHFVRRGLRKAKDERFQSASEVVQEVELIYSGHVRVQCPVTFTKRSMVEVVSAMERHPNAIVPLVLLTPLVMVGLIAAVAVLALG